jgi:branched-chain amino acid transport system ATP-binding protein
MGLIPPTQGSITFNGQNLSALPPHARAALGIGYMPEDRGLVPELTVEENILIPVWVNKALDAEERLSLVYKVLPELLEMRHRRALLLSGGQQKLAALARALAVGTRLLLLDEPFEGVAPALSKRLADVIAGLKGAEVSVLIAQSDLNHSRKLVDREFVIERGANLEKSKA